MSLMRKPVMEVIRFVENDIVVASGGGRGIVSQSFDLTGCTGGVPGDGSLTYNGVVYPLSSTGNVDTFIRALGADGISNAGISNGTSTQSLKHTLNAEVNRGANNWYDGTYVYDSSATWTNSNNTVLNGVFIRQ